MKYLVVLLALSALIFPALSQTIKRPAAGTVSKAAPAKSKAAPTPRKTTKPSDEAAEYVAAVAQTDPSARVDALQKFIAAHPKSAKSAAARERLVRSEAESANDSLKSGDTKAAAAMFISAVRDAPSPMPDPLFADVISKIPLALFWRGERAAAFEAADAMEAKSTTDQLLSISEFYISVENGAEAKRVALAIIEKTPDSPSAYLTLGLAERIDFQLEDSAAAYAKALELDPASVPARRGLAEMKRALARPDQAVVIYRELLTNDVASVPAQTGLVLALFESGKRIEAETEMAKSLETNSGNVMLLAGAAYWYGAHGEGKKAIELAQKAIATDPRFIWSHIALARGYIAERQPLDAERVLLGARRYGNFPTLEYEIASARLMAGFYRDAAEELAKSFSVKDGVISTRLGGRVARESADFTELIALERRASIAAPASGDTPGNAAKLRDLLDLWLKLESKDTDVDLLAKSAETFAAGDDNMRVHRQLFAARELLDRKKALPKAAELARAAIGNADAALEVVSPSAAVMADELYDSRRLAVVRDEYIRVPDVPRATLLNIMRGRIEDINGRALLDTGSTAEAVTRFKRAVGILPAGSSWWRNSSWRLGSALEAAGKGAEGLDQYIRSYKSGAPNVIRYSMIATLYRRINGSVDGLENEIGPDPSFAERASARSYPEPLPSATPEVQTTAQPDPVRAATVAVPPRVIPDPASSAEPAPAQTPEVRPVPTPEQTPIPETKGSAIPIPETVKNEPILVKPAEPAPSPAAAEGSTQPLPDSSPAPSPVPEETKPAPTPSASPINTSVAVVTSSPEPVAVAAPFRTKTFTDIRPAGGSSKELFPPVVITIPATSPKTAKQDAAEVSAASTIAAVPLPCMITLSESAITLQNNGGDLAVVVGTDDDRDLAGLSATSGEPRDVEVRREPIVGITGRSLFVLRSVSKRIGRFQVTFTLPCGRKELSVTVR